MLVEDRVRQAEDRIRVCQAEDRDKVRQAEDRDKVLQAEALNKMNVLNGNPLPDFPDNASH